MSIRRWTAPRDGHVTIEARLRHSSKKGNGVQGRLVFGESGLMGDYTAFDGFEQTDVDSIPVKTGETVDFAVGPLGSASFDTYMWSIRITMDRPEENGEGLRTLWEARADYEGPRDEMPDPLGRWAQLAHVLLLTNEFMYVD